MKNSMLFIASLIIAVSFMFSAIELKAEDKKEVEIKTTAQCGMCKKRIEKNLNKQDGILSSEVTVKTAMLTVEYDAEKLEENDVRVMVTKIGYAADSLKADEEAYTNLHKCCKLPEDR